MLNADSRPMSRLWLVLLLAAALGLRVGWSLLAPGEPISFQSLPDQADYMGIARNLLARQGFVHVDARFGDQVLADRMPLYPLFLALCGANLTVVRMAQGLIDTSTVLAVYLLGRRLVTPRQSLLAGALVAFNPFLVYFSALALSETLFTAMLAWSLVLLARPAPMVLPGLLLALSILVRPSAIALPVVLGIAGAFLRRATLPMRKPRWPAPVGSTMLLLTVVVLFPWALRNRAVLGQWVWTTTNSGFVAFDGFNESATGASDQSTLSGLEWNMRLRRLSEAQRSELLGQHARQYAARMLREDPARLAKLTVSKIARMWSPVPLSREFSSRRNVAVGLVFSIPFYVLIVLGLWKSTLPRAVKGFLLMPALYFTVVHAVSVGSLRYRMPAEPALAVLAAVGAGVLVSYIRPPVWRRSRAPSSSPARG